MATVTVDNRGLSPPEPLVRILGALPSLGDDDALVALMDREPLLLYPELERRGFTWRFEEGAEFHTLTVTHAGLEP
jgi:hypothetical protein